MLSVEGTGEHFLALWKNIPCRMKRYPKSPHPMEGTRATYDHIASFLYDSLDFKPIFNKPIYFLEPEPFIAIEI